MPAPHSHGHIEFNWLTQGTMDYVFDGGPVTVGPERLVAFWAGIPHQTTALNDVGEGKQLNIYLPMDAFLEMPQLGRLTETLMGGGVIQLSPECIGLDTLERWHADYRSGNSLRTDLVRAEIGTMFRRAAITGWDTLLPAWLEKTGSRTRTTTPVRYVVRMVRHIVENITDPLSAEDIARVVACTQLRDQSLHQGHAHLGAEIRHPHAPDPRPLAALRREPLHRQRRLPVRLRQPDPVLRTLPQGLWHDPQPDAQGHDQLTVSKRQMLCAVEACR